MRTDATTLDTYQHRAGTEAAIFVRDLTVTPELVFDWGDTVWICIDGIPSDAISSDVHQSSGTLSQGLERIQERQPAILKRANELRAALGDPLAELARILQSIPVEDDVWDRIAEEPYG